MVPKPKVILYVDPNCPSCTSFKPIMRKLAAQNHLSIETRDVQRCPRDDKLCPTVKLVPAVAYDGSEIPFERIPERLRELGRRKK